MSGLKRSGIGTLVTKDKLPPELENLLAIGTLKKGKDQREIIR